MPFYTGKGIPGEPGFEMKEFEGMYTSPCGKYFSSIPWTNDMYPDMKRMDKQAKKQEWKNRIKNFIKNNNGRAGV